MDFQLYSRVDEASELFGDPLTLAYILTLAKLTAPLTKPGTRALREIQEYSASISRERKSAVYALIRYTRGLERRAFRALISENKIVCSILEAGATIYKGKKAYLELISDLQTHVGAVEFSIGEIPLEKLPPDIRDHISSAIAEAPSPVEQLKEKVVWQARITASVYETPAFMGFKCETPGGAKFAWVLKYEHARRRGPLLQNAVEALAFLSLTAEEIYEELVKRGVKDTMAREFVPFLRNLAYVEGLFSSKVVLDPAQYYNEPTMVVENSINGAMLSELYGKEIPANRALSIAVKGLGASILLQLRGYTHAGLSPNIIEVSITDKEVEVLLHGTIFIHKLGEWAPPELVDFLSLDPLSILSKKFTNYNEVYALILSITELLAGKPNLYRRGLNAVLAKLIHGVDLGDVFSKGLEEGDVNKISEAAAKFSSSPEESLRELNAWLAEKEKGLWEALKPLGPISEVFQRALSLDPTRRYASPLEAYLMLKALAVA